MLCTIPANPDISGIGVRAAIYIQNFLCFVPAIWAIWDGHVSDYELESAETHSTTNLVLAFAILISCIFQAIGRGLTNYHTSIVLGLSWMNNTNAFVYFLLYVQYKSQGGTGRVEPKLSSWVDHIKNNLLTILCVPEGSTLRSSTRNKEPGINAAKNAAGTLFKRIALSLGSLHLTLMAALGIWLWSSPQSFGAIESAKCATQVADLAVLGARVPFSSQALRITSLTIYSLLLVPGINLLLPMLLFLGFHCWYHSRRPTPEILPQHTPNVQSSTLTITERFRKVLTVCAGLVFLLAVNIVFVTDIELTLRRNGGMQEAGESEWGFGQILAILLVFMPLRDLVEAIIRRRQEMQTKLNDALKKAMNHGNIQEMTRWLNAGADPNVRADNERTVLEVAVLAEGNASLIQDLVKAVADVNEELSDGRTALEVAVLAKNLDLVRCLIEAGASVITLLHHASAKDVDSVTVLLESGADANVQDEDGDTPLHQAAFDGQVDCMKVLLEHRADTSIRNKRGCTALHLACHSGYADGVTVLLERGVDPNVQDNGGSGDTPLHCAARKNGQVDCLKVLLEHGADASIRNKKGFTALHRASAKDADSVTVLLESGADPNIQDKDGKTPLHWATTRNQVDCLKVLLEHGADTSIRDKYGSRALHWASAKDADSATVLLESGADPNIQDNMGHTPLHWAAINGQVDFLKVLLEHGADASVPNKYGSTALHWASVMDADSVTALLECGADPNLQDNGGDTPLHIAADYGQMDSLKALFEHGADASIQNKSGQTALQLAQEKHSGEQLSKISKLFQSYGVTV